MKINALKIKNNCFFLRNSAFFPINKSYLSIFFIYLYFSSFFAKLDTCKIKRIRWVAKSNACDFENFQHWQRYTHVKSNSLTHIRTWRTLLMPCLTSSTICKKRIYNIFQKFLIKIKRFFASRKSSAIMYQWCKWSAKLLHKIAWLLLILRF